MSSTPEIDRPTPAERRSTLQIVFVTLFVDLIGFSIIFPLFPGMLEYYSTQSPPSPLFNAFYASLQSFTDYIGLGGGHWGIIVLFGGLLGSLYSLLQFVGAPLFGALSDRVGRRPVLLVSLAGILVSYIIWFLAGSFELLVVARLLGGIMSANISTATAIVADVTDLKERSRGMAVIGIAFGLGFVIGPAVGGMSASIDLSTMYPQLAAYGVNPFSTPALIAIVLTTFNLVFASLRLPETRRLAAGPRPERSANPFVLLRTVDYPGVTRTNLTYFLFLLAFSGMEFSLTFLAHERLDYGPKQNALMFLFVGGILVLIQGGYVRRRSNTVGPRRMTLHGLTMLVPALFIIGIAGGMRSQLVLYFGLTLLAAGSAQATPCLTALASAYAPAEDQGRVLGIFRSLGALARAIGPLFAAALYWWQGPVAAYCLGGAFVVIPLIMAIKLPSLPAHATEHP